MSTTVKSKLKKLPHNPGVYIFLGKGESASGEKNIKGQILYIGKATSLKSRVSSYFNGAHDSRIEKMISQIEDFEVKETDSVLEALILEANLIKKHQPKYNVKEKDDKSFSYFVITKEEFPRVLIVRKTDLKSVQRSTFNVERSFGPYTSKKQMQVALKIIRRIFPFHFNKAQTEKGCLDFQIGLCPGPYAGAISKTDYRKNIRGIRMILEGKKKTLIRKMEKEMQEHAKKHEYEKAGEWKNKIFALNHIQDVALMTSEGETILQETRQTTRSMRIEAYDISNISGQYAVGSMVVFNASGPDKSQYRKFKIKTVKGANDTGMMKEVLERRFKNDWPHPNLLILDGGQGHLNMGQGVLAKNKFKIPIIAVAKGPERKKMEVFGFENISDAKLLLFIKNENKLKEITDEAHRFAIGYHKQVRKRGFLKA